MSYIAHDISKSNFVGMAEENYKKCETISEDNNQPLLICKQFGPKILETDNLCEIQLIRGKQSSDSCEYNVIKTNNNKRKINGYINSTYQRR